MRVRNLSIETVDDWYLAERIVHFCVRIDLSIQVDFSHEEGKGGGERL